MIVRIMRAALFFVLLPRHPKAFSVRNRRECNFRVFGDNGQVGQALKEPYVLADAVRIREVLVNILGNAVKFTNDGGASHGAGG